MKLPTVSYMTDDQGIYGLRRSKLEFFVLNVNLSNPIYCHSYILSPTFSCVLQSRVITLVYVDWNRSDDSYPILIYSGLETCALSAPLGLLLFLSSLLL